MTRLVAERGTHRGTTLSAVLDDVAVGVCRRNRVLRFL